MLTKQGEHFIDFVHSECWFSPFQVSDKTKSDSGSFSQLYLGEAETLSFILDML